MKVLIVGGGGREHAIAWKIKQSPRVSKLYCAPGNGGTAQIATNVAIKATDLAALTAFAVQEGVDLVFVAPDDPLAMGLVDELERVGIRAFGPAKPLPDRVEQGFCQRFDAPLSNSDGGLCCF